MESTKADDNGFLFKSKLSLCDLAGSEKIQNDIAVVGQHFKELKNINLSLTTLSKVINALASGASHIPYRESKVTRLLQDCIGGNNNTIIIANISSLEDNADESINTMHFIDSAKKIAIAPSENKVNAADDELVRKLQKELQYYKSMITYKAKGSLEVELITLKKENDKLKSIHSNVNIVEQLKKENLKMRKQLQKMKEGAKDGMNTLYSNHNGNEYEDRNNSRESQRTSVNMTAKIENNKIAQIKNFARQYSLQAVVKNRCPICTLPLPCKHYKTIDEFKADIPSSALKIIKNVIF